MGLWHDSVGRKGVEDDRAAYTNIVFTVLCVPFKPSGAYYDQVADTWEDYIYEELFKADEGE